jgi:peptide/nickel transport system permease protein
MKPANIDADEAQGRAVSPFARTLKRFTKHRGAMIGVALLLCLVTLVVAAPLLTANDPIDISPAEALEPPSLDHIMGTDQLGRDVFSRVLYGGRVSLRVGLIAVIIGALAGIFLGMLSGFYGGWLDSFFSWIGDVLLAFPGILLALVIIAILGPGLTNVMIAVGISFIPSFMRVTRGAVFSARELEYVEAAYALGNREYAIMGRHTRFGIAWRWYGHYCRCCPKFPGARPTTTRA